MTVAPVAAIFLYWLQLPSVPKPLIGQGVASTKLTARPMWGLIAGFSFRRTTGPRTQVTGMDGIAGETLERGLPLRAAG